MKAIEWRPTPWTRKLARQVVAAEKIFKCEVPIIQPGRACLVCAASLPSPSIRWTCSEWCRREHCRAKQRAKRLRKHTRGRVKPSEVYVPKYVTSPVITAKCKRCGDFFQYDCMKGQTWRRLCDACRVLPYHVRKFTACMACGGALIGNRFKYCSDECREFYIYPAFARPTTPHKNCLNCGKPNPASPPHRKYCSRACLIAVKDHSPQARARKSERSHESYVRMRGTYLAHLRVQQMIAEGSQRPESSERAVDAITIRRE